MFIDLSKETERGITDGLRVDTKGNLYETGPGGVWIISPEGKHLGTIRAPEQSTNIGLRRRRQEDALHRGAHRHLQDQGDHAGHLNVSIEDGGLFSSSPGHSPLRDVRRPVQ